MNSSNQRCVPELLAYLIHRTIDLTRLVDIEGKRWLQPARFAQARDGDAEQGETAICDDQGRLFQQFATYAQERGGRSGRLRESAGSGDSGVVGEPQPQGERSAPSARITQTTRHFLD